jgi:hypothetical protein
MVEEVNIAVQRCGIIDFRCMHAMLYACDFATPRVSQYPA